GRSRRCSRRFSNVGGRRTTAVNILPSRNVLLIKTLRRISTGFSSQEAAHGSPTTRYVGPPAPGRGRLDLVAVGRRFRLSRSDLRRQPGPVLREGSLFSLLVYLVRDALLESELYPHLLIDRSTHSN